MAMIPKDRRSDALSEGLFGDSTWSDPTDFTRFAHLPVQERVADRLADVLFGVDDIVGLLSEESAASIRWMEPHVRKIFDDVDQLMRKVSD
jgi:hypothetical protein